VLVRAAAALQVGVEELISAPKALCKLYRAETLPRRGRSGVQIRQLLTGTLVGLQMERMELTPGARMRGVPHTAGTREYLTCEIGRVTLAVAGEQWTLEEGDVIVFRGDQKHSYSNPGRGKAVAYSVVVLTPGRMS
jgi:quercetin dioxygenase-like cupin family protein